MPLIDRGGAVPIMSGALGGEMAGAKLRVPARIGR
jgi:hypothetical protein